HQDRHAGLGGHRQGRCKRFKKARGAHPRGARSCEDFHQRQATRFGRRASAGIAPRGQRVLSADGVRVLKEQLLPLATLVTPNLPEARALAGLRGSGRGEVERAGRKLIAMGAKAALIKGGHSTRETVDDILVWERGAELYAFP